MNKLAPTPKEIAVASRNHTQFNGNFVVDWAIFHQTLDVSETLLAAATRGCMSLFAVCSVPLLYVESKSASREVNMLVPVQLAQDELAEDKTPVDKTPDSKSVEMPETLLEIGSFESGRAARAVVGVSEYPCQHLLQELPLLLKNTGKVASKAVGIVSAEITVMSKQLAHPKPMFAINPTGTNNRIENAHANVRPESVTVNPAVENTFCMRSATDSLTASGLESKPRPRLRALSSSCIRVQMKRL
jgi:hypothetical protein